MFSLVVNETSTALVGCTFENGTCGWEDISVGQCQWTRESNSFGIGPPNDHTVGTAAGEANHFWTRAVCVVGAKLLFK